MYVRIPVSRTGSEIDVSPRVTSTPERASVPLESMPVLRAIENGGAGWSNSRALVWSVAPVCWAELPEICRSGSRSRSKVSENLLPTIKGRRLPIRDFQAESNSLPTFMIFRTAASPPVQHLEGTGRRRRGSPHRAPWVDKSPLPPWEFRKQQPEKSKGNMK